MIKDAYPLPLLDNLLDMAQGAIVMSKFDLTASYNQIPIQQQDRWKTTFITSQGLFKFNVMHFGFSNTPPHMQRYMEHILQPVEHRNIQVYLDDIPAFLKTREEHIQTLKMVLQWFREEKLFAKAKKCEFLLPEIDLLGVKVSVKGFCMEEKKVTQVREWKPPKNMQGVREFLGFINFYHRFIKGFAQMVRPLHDLTMKETPWTWESKQNKAFEQLKEAVTSEPVLKYANPREQFRMETDTSNFAYRAILSQKQPTGKRHPVAYMSKSMTPAEKNYDIGNKEALAIVKPLQHWQHWLEGTRTPIKIITNHKNLVNFSKPQILNQRQMRWLHALQRYNFVIGYRLGVQNSAADALSQQQDLAAEGDKQTPQTLLSPQQFVELNLIAVDSMTAAFLDAIATDSKILDEIRQASVEAEPTKDGRAVVPDVPEIKRKILQLYHDAPIAGHPGMTGMYELASRLYTWPKMKEYVDDDVHGCAICAKAKKKNIQEQGKLQPLPNPMTPWHWTESDLIGPLPKSKGKDAIYMVVDRFTKYAYFIPCNMMETTQSLAQLHAKYVWSHKGLPQIHSTDRGPQFKAEYTKELY
jgi:hypothetical protein